MTGVDKVDSDAINVMILRAVLADKKMVCSLLGHKGSSKGASKLFSSKKEVWATLMICLGKHSHTVVRSLRESAVEKRIKLLVAVVKEMSQS